MRKLLDAQGYTLLEALFQLFLLVMMVQLLLSHQTVMHTLKQAFYSKDTAWETFVNDMQMYIDAAPEPFYTTGTKEITRILHQSNGTFFVEKFNVGSQYIRRQKNTGNEPLLHNVSTMYVTIDAHELYMKITFLDGSVRERVFIVPTEA